MEAARRTALASLAGLAALALWAPRAAADEPWLLAIEGHAALPVSEPQRDLFGPGAAASISLHRPLADFLLLGARLRAGFLSDGRPPSDPARVDPGPADLFGLSLSLRLRPLSGVLPGPARASGLFVEVGAGAALTGGLLRPSAEGAIGWGFELGDLTLAPAVRWVGVFEVDNQLDDRPAHLLLAGLELTFFDARPVPLEPGAVVGDRDRDGIADDVDACTEEPEDRDGFQDEDGCPEADDDGDGIPDAEDACPFVPEDHDGFEDEDGCPDRDDDGDGFIDEDDACPREAEVVNGVDDRDGCPDEGLVTLLDDRIVLDERVLFDTRRVRVRRRARPVLDAIAELYRQHPEWVRLRVEGHADVRGGLGFNQRLSELRARQVVRALVERGVPAEIIDGLGYGESRPRTEGSSEDAHQANRRVEFVVVARRELTVEEREVELEARRRAAAERRAQLARTHGGAR